MSRVRAPPAARTRSRLASRSREYNKKSGAVEPRVAAADSTHRPPISRRPLPGGARAVAPGAAVLLGARAVARRGLWLRARGLLHRGRRCCSARGLLLRARGLLHWGARAVAPGARSVARGAAVLLRARGLLLGARQRDGSPRRVVLQHLRDAPPYLSLRRVVVDLQRAGWVVFDLEAHGRVRLALGQRCAESKAGAGCRRALVVLRCDGAPLCALDVRLGFDLDVAHHVRGCRRRADRCERSRRDHHGGTHDRV